ncbi:MAG: exodeoxyribonuclease V subunit gamma [Planctomycetes bacterium]|nr:exodeoxyribonuclease V subunit gamma [Planctomycetota bacterium]
MVETVHILASPAGSGKTTQLLARCREAATRGPASVLWLAPTLRRAEQVRALLAEGAGAWRAGDPLARLPRKAVEMGCLSPFVLTFQDFADDLVAANDPDARPLSRVQRRLLLDEVIAELHDQGRLPYFARVVDTRGFAEGVFALVEELQRQEIGPAQFARVASRRLPAETEEEGPGRDPHAKERQCARLYARYQQRLADHHLLDPEGRLWRVRDLLARAMPRPFDTVRAVFVDDFVRFTKVQHDLLESLGCLCEELWIALPDEPGEERTELFSASRATLQRLRSLHPEASGGREPPDSCYHQGAHALRSPGGLMHLERRLFRPLRNSRPAEDATGLLCLQAPAMLGEARMVARHVKSLLREGVAAEEVLVTMRDVLPYADLVREVFGEYGIPVDVEGAEPLTRNPAVALLLKALRLPEDDWPFAAVTALLRSSYFRPQWPEARFDPDVSQLAEVLLRLLGEPRGREAYLEAVRRWAGAPGAGPPQGLEDEQAEESRRRRTHELAKKCSPFLERFFRSWEGMPHLAPLVEHVSWVRSFASDLGISHAVRAIDGAAWQRLWVEVEQWRTRDLLATRAGDVLAGRKRLLDRKTFLRRLTALASEAGLARTPRGPGRVRVLSAPLARHLDADHVFVMGLGERSFPRLVAPTPLFDEAERQRLRDAGLDFVGVADLMPDEMLLFYQLVTRARRRLVLSYPAVDERGQDLLPSSFLNAVLDCFVPGAVPVERRGMLIEGFDRDEPLSPAEHRVRAARSVSEVSETNLLRSGLAPHLAANLAAAALVARQRFHAGDYTPFDGLFRDPAVIGEVRRLFGPEKVFSPTALEDYVACPFRFFLGHVLRLEPLQEPREEIEVTRRGQAVHRALSRLHRQLREAGVHEPAEGVDAHVLERFREAIAEDIERAPGPASKALWTLEGERLLRVAARYRGQWQEFVKPWATLEVRPEPYFFEIDFGLPVDSEVPAALHGPLVIRGDELEVRISGRIDRVDVAKLGGDLGFWIIDYKTGRAEHYTSKALVGFEKLQLTLYALAVEEVLLAGEAVRPLGLAYWLVADSGPKVVLPGRNAALWFNESERWRQVREQLRQWVVTLVNNIRAGIYPLKPRSDHCTQTCAFGQVCRITQSRSVAKAWSLPLPVLAEPPKKTPDDEACS